MRGERAARLRADKDVAAIFMEAGSHVTNERYREERDDKSQDFRDELSGGMKEGTERSERVNDGPLTCCSCKVLLAKIT